MNIDLALPEEPHPHIDGGVAPKKVIVSYGFWLFIVSDLIIFASLFATYGVLRGSTDGGPSEKDVFDISHVAIETAILLLSSFTCGLAGIAAFNKSKFYTQIFMGVTLLLGIAFIGMEISEFRALIADGAGPQRSAFLSAFFTLVGCHGLHVSVGILWAIFIQISLWKKGFSKDVVRKLMCFFLFWHALDVVWVGVFTIVYLVGVI